MVKNIVKTIKSFMTKSSFPYFFAAISFACIFLYLLRTLPGIQKISLDMEIDHPDSVKLYFSSSKKFSELKTSRSFRSGPKRSVIKISLEPNYANYVRLDTGDFTGTAKIYRMEISSFFCPSLLLGPKEIAAQFATNPANAQMKVSGDHLNVISFGNDPYIYCKKRLYPPQYFLSFLVASLFSTGIFILSSFHDRQSAPSLINEDKSPKKLQRIPVLDGLRGIAAIMVVADHTWGWFRGVGASGVWIFFALSGFLLANPFIDNPNLITSPVYLSGYFKRRLFRIIPIYYTYIFIVFILSKRFDLAFLHTLFLEGDGHLWAIPQEILFYLLLPAVILLIIIPLQRRHRMLIPPVLLGIMVAFNHFIGIDIFWLLGMDHIKLPLFFGVFLSGVFTAFTVSIYGPAFHGRAWVRKYLHRCASPTGIIILLFFFLFSTGHILGQKTVYSQKYFGTFGIFAGILLACTLFAKHTLLEKILSFRFLRSLGIVSLSLYLVHPLMKIIAQDFFLTYFDFKLTGFPLFLSTISISYFVSYYTYNWIESPGLTLITDRSRFLTLTPVQTAQADINQDELMETPAVFARHSDR